MNFVGLGFSFKAEDDGVLAFIQNVETRLDRVTGQLGRTSREAREASSSLEAMSADGARAAGQLTQATDNAHRGFEDVNRTVNALRSSLGNVFRISAVDVNEYGAALDSVSDVMERLASDAISSTQAQGQAHQQVINTTIEAMTALKKQASDSRDVRTQTRATAALQRFRIELKKTIEEEEKLKGLNAFEALAIAERESNRSILHDISTRMHVSKKATEEDVKETRAAIARARMVATTRAELRDLMAQIEGASAPGAFRQAKFEDMADRFRAGAGEGAAGKAGAIKNFLFGGGDSRGIIPVAKNIFDKIGDFSARPGLELRKQLDTFETQVRARLGATAQEYQDLQEAIVKTSNSTGVQDTVLIDLNKQLLQSGFSVKELGDRSNDYVRIGADFISTMGMSTEEVAGFVTAAKSTGVGKEGFKRMANEATRLERSFGTLGLVEEFPDLMVNARKNAIALGRDFTGTAEQSATAAAKMGLVIKSQIGGNIKDAISTARGLTDTFTDMADDIAATMGGLQDDFGPNVQGAMQVLARAGIQGQNFFNLMNEAALDPEKGLPKVADALAQVLNNSKGQPQLFGRMRLLIKRGFGADMTATVLKMAQTHRSYNDILKSAEEEARKNNKQIDKESEAQKEVARQLKESFEIREKMLQNTKDNILALSITRQEMAAMKSGLTAVTVQLEKMVDKLQALHKASATDDRSFFDSQTAGWTAVGIAAAGTLAQLTQIPGVLNLLKGAGGWLFGGGGVGGAGGAAATAAAGGAGSGFMASGFGLGKLGAAGTVAGIALAVNAAVAALKGIDKGVEVLNATGDKTLAVQVSAAEFGKQFYTQFPKWIDATFGTKIAEPIVNAVETLSGEKQAREQLAQTTKTDVANFAMTQSSESLQNARFGADRQRLVSEALAKFKADDTARRALLTDDVWEKISGRLAETDLSAENRREYRRGVLTGKILPPELEQKIAHDATEQLLGEYGSLVRQLGRPELLQGATPITDLRKMTAEKAAGEARRAAAQEALEADIARNKERQAARLSAEIQAVEDALKRGPSDESNTTEKDILYQLALEDIIEGIKTGKKTDFDPELLQRSINDLLTTLADIGERIRPEVKVQINADTELLRRALQSRVDHDRGATGRPKRVG